MTSTRPPIDVSVPAVVLKFDPNVMHHGGLGVIRSLGRLGIPVYGVHEGPWAPAANSRYLHGRCYWQADSGDVTGVVNGLLALAERIGRPAVLIPTDDAGSIFLAEHGDHLRPSFLFPAPPAGLPRQVAGKHSLHELCQDLGVPSPRVAVPESLAAARDFAAQAGFPLIAKLTTPWAGSRRKLPSTSILADRSELDAAYDTCRQAGAGLMLQDYIPAAPGAQDWFFHGYCDATSQCRPAFTGVKERSYPARAGLTSLGRAVANDRLRDEVTAILSRLNYRGILDLDLRLDPRDGQYKLLDFNPRLGAQFRVFRDAAGTDVALAQYLDMTGGTIPAAQQVSGRALLVENYDPISAVAHWRRGELGLRPWLASLHGVQEAAWFARDDLRPFGLMCARMGWRLATRPLARDAGRPPRGGFRYAAGRAAGGSPKNKAIHKPHVNEDMTKRRATPQAPKEGTRV